MAVHWWRGLRNRSSGESEGKDAPARTEPPARTDPPARTGGAKLVVNGVGAIVTGLALAVILTAKFVEGAWLTLIIIPATIVLLWAVRRYYDEIDRQILTGSQRQIDLRQHAPPIVLVPIKRWDRLARKTLEYALRLSPDVTALHVADLGGPDAEDKRTEFRQSWHEFVEQPALRTGLQPPRLQLVSSEFRSIVAPLLRAVEAVQRQHPGRPVTVILPELVEGRWWGYLMHANRERRLRRRLLHYGGPSLVVSTVPWQLRAVDAARAIHEEEPPPPAR